VVHQCVFRAPDREGTRAALAERAVATGVHYPLALTQQPAYAACATAPCPTAEAWAATCVSVPCFPELSDEEVDIVARALEAVDR
jgi:dTDP-4-amino-4,6-dideoxygalactose transaminase